MRTYEEIANLLRLALQESGKGRIRLSRKTLLNISGRQRIQMGLLDNIASWMDGEAFLLNLGDRGYAVVNQGSLEGIPLAKMSDIIPDWKDLSPEDVWNRIEGNHLEEDE